MAHSFSVARRARLALLGGTLLFLVAQLVLNIFIERWQPCIRYPEYGYHLAGLRRLLAAEPGRPLLLAQGSSRTLMGFRPDVLPSYRTPSGSVPLAFNFGVARCGPLLALLHLQQLLAEGIRPDWLLLEIPPFMMAAPDGGAKSLPAERVSWFDLHLMSGLVSRPWLLYQDWPAGRLFPAYADRKGLLCRYGPNFCAIEAFDTHGFFRLCPDRFGWLPWGDADPTPERRRRWLAKLEPSYSLQFSAGSDQILRRLLALCREKAIPVVLCLMPEGDEFRRRYDPASLAALDAYFARLIRECGIGFVDARRWIAEEDFIDSHHLLRRGARWYTERLGREVIRPLVAGELR